MMLSAPLDHTCKSIVDAIRDDGSILVCTGSWLRGDDAACLTLCQSLLGIAGSKVELCEHGLESCPLLSIIEARRPEKLVICDAAHIPDLAPGSLVELELEELEKEVVSLSTHSLSQSLLLGKVKNLFPDLEIKILAVNVARLDVSLELSEDVRRTIRELLRCVEVETERKDVELSVI
ncbi:MAG: hydrogenase maturation protease [Acidilobaceae archaeon]